MKNCKQNFKLSKRRLNKKEENLRMSIILMCLLIDHHYLRSFFLVFVFGRLVLLNLRLLDFLHGSLSLLFLVFLLHFFHPFWDLLFLFDLHIFLRLLLLKSPFINLTIKCFIIFSNRRKQWLMNST